MHWQTASHIPVPMIHGFVHFIRSFIRSFLHPVKKGAGVVPTIQVRKPRLREVKGVVQLTSQWQAGSPGAFGLSPACWGPSCLFQRLQVRAAAPSRLWYFFSFLFCFLSDESPFWGPSCLSPGVGRPCPGKETPSRRRPASALGTPRSPCELTQPRLPGHEAWALVGTVPAEPCPVPWAGPGSDLVGELPGPFGLGSWPSVCLPFI